MTYLLECFAEFLIWIGEGVDEMYDDIFVWRDGTNMAEWKKRHNL